MTAATNDAPTARETAARAVRHHRRRSTTCARARWSSSATTRTARTRATSPWPPQFVTAESVNFMAKHGRGLICLALTPERCAELDLPPMRRTTRRACRPRSPSPSRRARASPPASPPPTARTPSRSPSTPSRRPGDLVQPGHVFPLARARRRARARRADRGGRRSGAPRRPRPGRRHLRDHERRRHHGARARPRSRSRASTGSRSSPSPTSSSTGAATSSWSRRAADGRRCPTQYGDFRPSATRRCSTAASTWRSSRATSPARRTCWCACTPSA